MKKNLAIFAIFLLVGTLSQAQCDKKQLLAASKTIYLDTSGNIQRTVEEKSVIHISPSGIDISVNDEPKMKLTVKSTTCNWATPFKKGRTLLTTTGSGNEGQSFNSTVDIEGKDDKITLLFKLEGRPVVIKLELDKFEEEK